MVERTRIVRGPEVLRPLGLAVLTRIVEEVVTRGLRHADKAIERAFRDNSGLGSKERALIAELAWGLMRRLDRLALALSALRREAAGDDAADPFRVRPTDARAVVELLLEDTPTHDAEGTERSHLAFMLLREPRLAADLALPVETARAALRAATRYVATCDGATRVALERGYPRAFVDALADDLGPSEATRALAAMNGRAPLTLRVNTLKATREQAQSRLRDAGFESHTSPLSPSAIVLERRTNVHALDAFRDGWVEAQDEGSQWIADSVRARAGEQVLDACAGAGGKSLALGAAMENKGRLVALDVSARRLAECKRRAGRAGLFNVETRLLAPDRPWPAQLVNAFDAVLVDAPCTGSGALRRNPEMRWHQGSAWFDRFPPQQREILAAAARCVKRNGRLIYATCSLLRREDEAVVNDFVASQEGAWTIARSERVGPLEGGPDGFFAATLIRTT